jgi:iron complex transport system substrate-binding protein
MRVFASLLAASLALLAGVAAEAAPRRVASLNLCTDELLLLARPEQIASVTHLSQQEAETPLWRQALL